MPLSFHRSLRSQRLGCLFPFYSRKIRWITLIAEVAQIKIFQLCDFLEQCVLWVDVEQAIRMSYHISVTKLLWKETWWQWGVLLRKNYFKPKIIQLFASRCLKKTHSNKRMGHKSLFRNNFFSLLFGKLSLFVKSLCSLFSVGSLTFKRDWKHADKGWKS